MRELQRVGRYPQAVVARQVTRAAVRSGLVWGLVFGAFVAAQLYAYTSSYPTQVARDAMAAAYGTNTGLIALFGPAHLINTVPGYAAWRLPGILSILGSVWGLLLSTRLIRGEEETGRSELLLAGPTTRRRAGVQAVAGLGAGLIALLALTVLGTLVIANTSAVDFTLAQSLYLSLTLVSGGAVFLAVGALTSQLVGTRRQALALGGAVLGSCYGLRMVADSDQRLHWLAWLSPLGWIEQSRPLIGPRPAALLLVLALVIALAAATVRLAGSRDLGGTTLAERSAAEPHLALLGSAASLAVRLIRSAVLGWLFAVAAFSVLLGTVVESSTKDISSNASIQQMIGRLGGHGSLVELYLGLTFLLLALLVAMIAAGQIAAVRTEEADGHLENLLVRAVSRTSWFIGRMLLAALAVVLAGVIAGIGAWGGAVSQHSDVAFGALLAAGLNVVAPSLFLIGLGALVFGAAPRVTSAVVYGYLAWSFLLEFIGGIGRPNHWLMDTSVFFHLVPAPARAPDWVSFAVISGLALLGTAAGGVLFNRRDLVGP